MSEVKRVEREIEQLEIIRDDLTKHIRRLREHRDRLLKPARNGKPGVREVVSAIQFRPYVKRWVELHEIHHDTNGRYAIAERCNCSPVTITNILGETTPNRSGVQQEWVTLDLVDRMLSAMEMNHILGHLDIVEIKWPPGKNGTWKKKGRTTEPPQPPFHHYEEE